MNNIFSRMKMRGVKHDPLIRVEISKSSILYNYKQFSKLTDKMIAPVLKSNAYGHGLVTVARIFESEDVPFLVVDSFYEAKMLRRSAIKKPILVIGYSRLEQIKKNIKDVSYALTSLQQIREISKNLTKHCDFHLKIDTGMRRQGVMPDEIIDADKIIKKNKHFHVVGICSHFADSDNVDKSATLLQIREWHKSINAAKNLFSNLRYFHLSASAGASYINQFESNVVRLGIGLYGINSSPKLNIKLQPPLSMTGTITSLRQLKAGEGVGYNHIFKAKKEMRVASVSAGYYEGIDRRLSNKGSFTYNKIVCPIIGRVCMNITIVDISNAKRAKEGDEVLLISNNSEDRNSVVNIAKLCQTNPHDILVHIPEHLHRDLAK